MELLIVLALGLFYPFSPAHRSAVVVPGYSFTIRLSSEHSSTLPVSMPGGTNGWTGAVVSVGRRGRIDIIEGRGPLADGLAKGDYILFDSLEAIAVHPADKSFSRPGPAVPTASRVAELSKSKFTITNLQVTVDSLLPAEVINGRTTSHYRLTGSHTTTFDSVSVAGFSAAGPFTSEMQYTMDYYLADMPELLYFRWNSVPDSVPPGLTLPPMVSDFARQMSDAMARLPKGKKALRIATSFRTGNANSSIQINTSLDLLQIQSRDVDVRNLLLPDDYVAKPATGDPSRDSPEKWRRPPSERQHQRERPIRETDARRGSQRQCHWPFADC